MSEDLKVRDLIKRRGLAVRRPLGERLAARVGDRMWKRPNVCFSNRLYLRFGLADPWDPTGPRDDPDPVSLGPVAVRLGEKRRQPAPHLRPKSPPKKKEAPDPLAKYRRPAPKPKAPPESAPSSGPLRAPAPSPVGPRAVTSPGGRSVPLPVRPDLADHMGGARTAGPPAPGLPGPGGAQPGPPEAAGRRPPMPPRPARKRRAGRMSARAVRPPTPGPAALPPPEVVDLAPPQPVPPEPVVVAAPPAASPAAAPVPRRAAPVGPGGLDDLFGMGQQEGRMRMRRARKDAPAED